MKRYYAAKLWTEDMGYVPENPTEPYGRYTVVMADEADAEIARLCDAATDLLAVVEGVADGLLDVHMFASSRKLRDAINTYISAIGEEAER